MSAAAQVAVAVVSWNTRELLDACLASLRADADAGRAEVWVVDNASTDGSAELVAERHPWVHLVAREDNLGYGAAVNLVAQRTATPFVAPANADLRFAPDALQRLLEAVGRHPEAGALAPRLRLPDGGTQHTVHPFPTVAVGLATSTGAVRVPAIARRLVMEGHWDPGLERRVDWAHGAFLLVPRDAWEEIGGFDADQWLYAEDLDLCWRLARAGRPTWFVPDAVIEHRVSAAAAQRWDDAARLRRTQRAAYAWMAHRQGVRRTRVVALANVAGLLPRWALARALEALPGRRGRHRAGTLRGYLVAHREGFAPAAELERSRRTVAS